MPVQQHNTSLTADTSSKVTTKVMTSTDTIMETNSNGTNFFTPPQSKTHHSDHSHHHSSSHNHHDQVKSKNKSKDPSRLISMSVLKSMLQKAVRRKIVMKAIRLTRYCMKEIHQLQIDADKHHTNSMIIIVKEMREVRSKEVKAQLHS